MKLKSKLMMAVMAVVFLAAGSAWALPIDVSYTVTGKELNFSITNNMTGFNVYMIGFDIEAISGRTADPSNSSPRYYGYMALNSYYPDNYSRFNSFSLSSGNTLTDLKLVVESVPTEVDFVVLVKGAGSYSGNDYDQKWTIANLTNGNFYSFKGTTSIPEPATLLLFGFGLVGLAGLRKKLKK